MAPRKGQQGSGTANKLSLSAATKYDIGKFRYDLIPPESMDQVAEVFTIGANKYEDRNWEKGMRWGRVWGSMMRHAWSWWRGETHDPDDGQHHLASVAWAALVLMSYEHHEMIEWDDRVIDFEDPSE